MFASIKNSSLAGFLVALSLVVSWSVFSSAPADASEEFVPLTNREIFFSQDRHSPYSPEEVEHEPFTEAELRGDSWESRVANCDTIADYDTFADCMFRPWVYGF